MKLKRINVPLCCWHWTVSIHLHFLTGDPGTQDCLLSSPFPGWALSSLAFMPEDMNGHQARGVAGGEGGEDCQLISHLGSPGGPEGKESACNAGGPGSIPGLGRTPREGNGNQYSFFFCPLQYSCLENSMDRGTWWAALQGVTESGTRLNN